MDKYNFAFKKKSTGDEQTNPSPGAEISEGEDSYNARITSSSSDISLSPASGDLRGASVLVPAGSLAVGTDVSLVAGTSFATENTIAELGVSGNPETNGVGQALAVSGSSAPLAPMTISLPIPAEMGLVQNTRDLELLVVFYKFNLPGGKFRTGVMIRKEFDIDTDSIKFQSQYFGVFQAAFLTIRVDVKPAEVESTVAVLTKREAGALPAIEWSVSAAAGSDRTANFSFTVTGMKDLVSCVIVADRDKTYPFEVKTRVTTFGKFVQRAVAEEAHDIYFRASCLDQSGRDSGLSPWAKASIPASTSSVTPDNPTNPPAAVTPSVTSFSRANEATDGFINTAELSSPSPLFSIVGRDYTSMEFSGLLWNVPPANCDAGVSYPHTAIPAAGTIPATDGDYIVCARLTSSDGLKVYAKSPVVTRDTLAPVITGFALTNEASDGKINSSESTSTLSLAVLTGSGFVDDDFAVIATGTACDQNVTFGLAAIPTISALTGEDTKKLCARLTDAAQNRFYQATGSFQRDTVAPAAFAIANPTNAATLYVATPTITWNQSDATGVTYAVRIGSTDSCSNMADDTALTGSTGVTGLTYTVAPGLTFGSSYFVCVVASDAVGNTTAAASRSFSVQAPAFVCDAGDFNSNCTITSAKVMASGSVVNITGNLTLNNNLTVSSAPYQATLNIGGNLTIATGKVLSGNLTISAANITLQGTGAISADGLGEAGGTGGTSSVTPGSGTGGGNSVVNQAGGGGAHGGSGGGASGSGGVAQNSTYGNAASPITAGSGGGGGYSAGQGISNGGAGGGVLSLNIAGAIDFTGGSGKISAMGNGGGTKNAGGGAGGSLKVVTGQITNPGTGSFNVSGGTGGTAAPYGGGGGGGRIRVQSSNYSPTAIVVSGGAAGGPGATAGGFGSYTQSISGSVCDTGINGAGQTCTITTKRYAGDGESIAIMGSLLLSGGTGNIVAASPAGGFILKVAENFTVSSGATFAPAGSATPSAATRAKDALKELHAGSININGTMAGNFPLIMARTISLGTVGKILADGWGYSGATTVSTAGQGPGAGAAVSSSLNGAGHCGAGQGGGSTYDIGGYTFDYGSGGGVGTSATTAGSGGGIIRIVAPQSLTLAGGSLISAIGGDAAGGNWPAGGGSGGSIWLQTGVLSIPAGSEISVNGGKASFWSSTYYGGGGGAGCISIYRKAVSGPGTTSISGGQGQTSGFGATGSAATYDLSTAGSASIAFLTDSTYVASLTPTSLHNACTTEAINAGWPNSGGLSWKALISTNTVDAITLLTSERIISSRGAIIAQDKTDLFDGSIVSPIKFSASGAGVTSGSPVLTGTDSSGFYSAADACSLFSSVSGNAMAGNGEQTDSKWINDAVVSCSSSFRLYCISY